MCGCFSSTRGAVCLGESPGQLVYFICGNTLYFIYFISFSCVFLILRFFLGFSRCSREIFFLHRAYHYAPAMMIPFPSLTFITLVVSSLYECLNYYHSEWINKRKTMLNGVLLKRNERTGERRNLMEYNLMGKRTLTRVIGQISCEHLGKLFMSAALAFKAAHIRLARSFKFTTQCCSGNPANQSPLSSDIDIEYRVHYPKKISTKRYLTSLCRSRSLFSLYSLFCISWNVYGTRENPARAARRKLRSKIADEWTRDLWGCCVISERYRRFVRW